MYNLPISTTGFTMGNINFAIDPKGWQVRYIEENLLAILQVSDKTDSKEMWSMVYQDDLDILYQGFKQLMIGNAVGMLRFRMIVGSQTIWLGLTPFLATDEEQTLLIANVKLITAEVENLQTLLKFANKKNSMLQMLSHDLRGPLALANSLVNVLAKENLAPVNLRKTQAIADIIEQTLGLIADLVDKEIIETIEAPLVKKRVDLVRKLTEYIEQCKRFEDLNERTFTFEASNDYIGLELDEAKFMQVLNNLVTNALKFTRADGKITISLNEHPDHVSLIFSDNGIGIPQQLLPFIFDRYTMAKREGLHGEPTTGLGLYIVKEIVTWHGASIECESTEQVGTTFNIRFPKA